MIVRDSGEEMMDDVGISDVMKHLVQHAVVTVNGGERTTKPVPLVGVIVRERRVCVMEIRDDDESGVENEERTSIDGQHR